jgi:hypothetical protein
LGDDAKRQGDDEGDLVAVAVHPTRVDASLTQGFLGHGGIESEVVGSELLGGIYGTAVSVDGFRVCVRRADVAAAAALLAAPRDSASAEAHPDEDREAAAPVEVADATMRRAMGAAVFGLFICPPLALYAAYLVVAQGSLREARGTVSSRSPSRRSPSPCGASSGSSSCARSAASVPASASASASASVPASASVSVGVAALASHSQRPNASPLFLRTASVIGEGLDLIEFAVGDSHHEGCCRARWMMAEGSGCAMAIAA